MKGPNPTKNLIAYLYLTLLFLPSAVLGLVFQEQSFHLYDYLSQNITTYDQLVDQIKVKRQGFVLGEFSASTSTSPIISNEPEDLSQSNQSTANHYLTESDNLSEQFVQRLALVENQLSDPDFLSSLKGDKGDVGPAGPAGASATSASIPTIQYIYANTIAQNSVEPHNVTSVAAMNLSGETLVVKKADIGEWVDLKGTLKVDGATTLGGSLEVLGAVSLDNGLNVSGATTLPTLNASTTNLGYLLIYNNATTTGSEYIGGDLTLAGSGSVAGDLTVVGSINQTIGSITGATTTVTGNFKVQDADTSPIFYADNNNHKVGIGTASPTSALTIKDINATYLDSTNLVTNGIFDTDISNWTDSGSGWEWNNGTAYHDNDPYDASSLSQAVTVEAGATYVLQYDVSDNTNWGGLIPSLGGQELEDNYYEINYNARYIFTAIASGQVTLSLIIEDYNPDWPDWQFNGRIDNVSFKKLINWSSDNSALKILDSNNTIIFDLRTDHLNESLFLGQGSGENNTGGQYNLSLGNQSLYSNTSGAYNLAIGYQSLYSNTTGSENVALGYQSLYNNATSTNNIALGYQSLYSNWGGYNNIAIGPSALHSNTSGYVNIAVGDSSLYSNTTGIYDTAIGTWALYSNTTGVSNVAIGNNALTSNTIAHYNTAVGMNAMSSTVSGGSNTAVGRSSLNDNITGTNNIAIGYDSSANNTSATSTTVIGTLAARGEADYSNQYTVFIGTESGYKVTTGSNNNTAIGYRSAYNLTSGPNNIFLGYKAGESLTTGSKNIVIGYDIDTPAVDSANTLNIGNILFGTGLTGSGTSIAGSVGIATSTPGGYYGEKLTVAGGTMITGTTTVGTSNTLVVNTNEGRVGIGTASPSRMLEINSGTSGDASLYLVADTDNNYEGDNPYIKLSSDQGAIQSILGATYINEDSEGNTYTGSLSNALLLGTLQNTSLQFGTNDNVRMTIDDTGDIGIATTTPWAGMKLAVDGSILVTGDIYKSGTAYVNPDYVFAEYFGNPYHEPIPADYEFLSLSDLEQYVKSNSHLPGVSFNGGPISIFESNRLNLEKIEELSLYIIELNNRLGLVESNTTLQDASTIPATPLEDIVVLNHPLTINGDLIVEGQSYFNQDSVGQAKILAGTTTVEIIFTDEYEYLPIVTISSYGSDLLDKNINYTVATTTAKGFIIKISTTTESDLTFNWHAFASPEAKLFVSDGTSQTVSLEVPISNFQFPNNIQISNPNLEITTPVEESYTAGVVAGDSTVSEEETTTEQPPTEKPTTEETPAEEPTAEEIVVEQPSEDPVPEAPVMGQTEELEISDTGIINDAAIDALVEKIQASLITLPTE